MCRTVRSRPSGPRTVDLNQEQLTKQITCLIEKNQEQSKSNLPVAIKVYGTSLLQEQSAVHCWVFRNISQLISFHHSLKMLHAPKPQTHRQLDRTGQDGGGGRGAEGRRAGGDPRGKGAPRGDFLPP